MSATPVIGVDENLNAEDEKADKEVDLNKEEDLTEKEKETIEMIK